MTDAPTPSGAMQDAATREEMVEIAAEGISNRIDIDTGSHEWAEGAVDALFAAGFIAAPAPPVATVSADAIRAEALEEAAQAVERVWQVAEGPSGDYARASTRAMAAAIRALALLPKPAPQEESHDGA